VNHSAARSDDLGSDEVVAGQAVLRGQMTDAAAEGKTAHAGRPDDATRRDQAESLGRRVEVEPGRAPLCVRDPRFAVDVDAPHLREVDHEPAVKDAVPGGIVAASAHRDLELERPCEVERGRDVARTDAAHDHGRPAVDERVETAPRRVVLGLSRRKDDAGQRPAQIAQLLVETRAVGHRRRLYPPGRSAQKGTGGVVPARVALRPDRRSPHPADPRPRPASSGEP
jgi:hypothetical protein